MDKAKQIEALEFRANREDISITERLAVIYKIYKLRGITNPYLAEVQ